MYDQARREKYSKDKQGSRVNVSGTVCSVCERRYMCEMPACDYDLAYVKMTNETSHANAFVNDLLITDRQ